MTPSLVIVGTVALDDVKTPFGEVHNALGGSAFFAGISASYWTSVGVMAIVGPTAGWEGAVVVAGGMTDWRGAGF